MHDGINGKPFVTWEKQRALITCYLSFFTLIDCGREDIFISDYGIPTYTLTSPNYPDSYPNRMSCHWIVTSPYDTRIFAEFTSFDVEEYYDFVYVGYEPIYAEFGSDSGKHSPYALSGIELPPSFLSPGNMFYVTMTSDFNTFLQGFVLKFRVHSEYSGKLPLFAKRFISLNLVLNNPIDVSLYELILLFCI